MELIEGIAVSELCDYSFGDQSGQWGNIPTSFMKDANLNNVEFASKVFEVKKERDYMTLFIDNIRLYKREIKDVKPEDKAYVDSLMDKSDLLKLCAAFPDMRFIIFTNLEDTPIDEYIFDAIPDNVLRISAVNAIAHGGKVVPAPYGVQRRMNDGDDRIDILKKAMWESDYTYPYYLYVSHKEDSHEERTGIKELFRNNTWAIVDEHRVSYKDFLFRLKQCKFMICPRGNAVDCHRNWEVLYMRRVPVMKRDSYLEQLFKNYPVLWVDDFAEVTQTMLMDNYHLYEQAQDLILGELSLPYYFQTTLHKALYE
tara:strand:+ start:436 stop:1371 length:936 start_codon:yes stop_codon:yes gene_type:complete